MKLNLITCLLLFSFIARAQVNDRNLIKESAAKNIHSFLNLIPTGQESMYGFKTRQDFEKVRIEEPIQVYYLKSAKNKLFFVFSNQWRVPFSVDGQYISFLTVIKNNRSFEAVDLGGNILAKKIQELYAVLNKPSSQLILIRNTFLNADYVTDDFEELYTKNTDGEELKPDSRAIVYKINDNQPIKIQLSDFYSDTIQFIDQTKN